MSKEETVVVIGQVVEVLPNATFKIDALDRIVLGHISGKMRKFDIKIILGDEVEIEFSLYNFNRGRIIRRNK